MSHLAKPDVLLEVLADKLGPSVRDEAGMLTWELLLGSLDDDLNILPSHRFPDLPVNHIAAVSIQQTAQVIEGAANIEIRYVYMPMLMRSVRPLKTGSLAGWFARPSGQ
jgi:hypothetical protein